jgi:hypothetical protein
MARRMKGVGASKQLESLDISLSRQPIAKMPHRGRGHSRVFVIFSLLAAMLLPT